MTELPHIESFVTRCKDATEALSKTIKPAGEYDAYNVDAAAKKLHILNYGCFTHIFDSAAQKI